MRMAAGAHAQVDVGLGQLQVLKEHLRHVVVVVLALWNTSYSNLDSVEGAYSTGLARMHQELLKLLRVLRHLPCDAGDLHEIGAGTDDVQYPHMCFLAHAISM